MTLRSVMIAAVLLLCQGPAAAQDSTPMQRVQTTIDKVVAVLRDQTLDSNQRWAQIMPAIDESFDFRSMSQSVLATNWKSATPEERERFVEFFAKYIEQVYREKIEMYTDQKIIYKSETITDDRAVVETVIQTDSAEIPVNFTLKNNMGKWYAYDVVIEGVSLVANYRSTFAVIIKNEGMDGLLADIQRRVEKYIEEYPPPTVPGEEGTGAGEGTPEPEAAAPEAAGS